MPSTAVRHFARYRIRDLVAYGRVDGDRLVRLERAPWESPRETGDVDGLADVELLAPVVPTKIVCVGLNYPRAHRRERHRAARGRRRAARAAAVLQAAERGHRPGCRDRLPRGRHASRPRGRDGDRDRPRARAVPREDAMRFVAGITAFNDVSARNYQTAGRSMDKGERLRYVRASRTRPRDRSRARRAHRGVPRERRTPPAAATPPTSCSPCQSSSPSSLRS